MHEPPRPPRRLKSIDVLRGVAVLLVLVNHLDPQTVPGLPELRGPWAAVYWRLKQFGWTGVDLFFVLSGFLISGLLFSELGRRGTLDCVSFWWRRGFKIWPSYLALLLVLGVTGATGFLHGTTWSEQLGSLLPHLLFFQNYLEAKPNGPTWSLAVEEHFYLLLPLLLLGLAAGTRRRPVDWGRWLGWSTLGVMVVCLALRCARVLSGAHPDDFMRTHFRLDSLMVGVYCQYLWTYRRPGVERLLAWPRTALALSLVLLVPALFLPTRHAVMFTLGFPALALAYALLLLLWVGGTFSRWEDTLAATCLARVGTWSYNVYLWHFFMAALNLAFYAQVNQLLAERLSPSPSRFLLQAALYLGYSLAVGAAATWGIERPLLRLRERVSPSRAVPTPAPT